MRLEDMDPQAQERIKSMANTISKSQLERDKNALRGLYERDGKPRDMQTLLLAAGEQIQPAVRAMVDSGELAHYVLGEREYFRRTQKMKAYRPT